MSDMIDTKQRIIVLPSGRVHVETVNDEPSLTQQQFKDECDINNIMKKYNDTGVFTHLTSKEGVYADFSEIQDYREMVHTVQYANDAFASLPADVRKKFKNDPGELLAFVQDPKNYDEGVKLGIVKPKVVEDPPPPNAPKTTNEKNANSGNGPQA